MLKWKLNPVLIFLLKIFLASNNNKNNKPTTIYLTRDDIGRELIKAEVTLGLMECDPHTIPSNKVEDLLRDTLKHKRYDMAWILIRFVF